MIKRGKKILDFDFLKKVVEVFRLDTDCYKLSVETLDMPYVVKDDIMKDDALAAIKEVDMPGTLLFVRRAGDEHGHKERDYILAGEKFPNINFDTDDSEYGASYLAPVPKGEFIHTSAVVNLYQLKSYTSDALVDQWRSRDEDPVWLSYDEDLKTDSPHEYVKKLIAIFKCGYPDPRELSYLLGDSHAYTQGRIIAKDGFWSGYRQLEKYEKEHGKGSAGKDYCKNIKAVICYIDREKKDVKKIEMKIDVDYKWQRVHTLNIHFKDSVDLRKIHSKLKKDVKDIEMEITPERLAITHNAFKFNLFGSDSSKDGGPFKGLFGKSK
jgi:hypothetical protein